MTAMTGRQLYDVVAYRTSRTILQAYSTSFSLGTALLDPITRRGIEAVYGMVRVADEIVDTHRGPDARAVLDAMHRETLAAITRGWSADLVVHSFARVARYVGIGSAEIDPFFESMRMDLDQRAHDRRSFDRYVHGSAEVVGLMCLAVFLNADRPRGSTLRHPSEHAREGACALGAAFQKINFLRDLRTDHDGLGRSYFPELSVQALTPHQIQVITEEIRADLHCARNALADLPRRPRCAVAATLALFDALLDRLALSTPEELLAERVRLPRLVKIRVAFVAAASAARGQS